MSCSVIIDGSLSVHCDVSIEPTQSSLLSSYGYGSLGECVGAQLCIYRVFHIVSGVYACVGVVGRGSSVCVSESWCWVL